MTTLLLTNQLKKKYYEYDLYPIVLIFVFYILGMVTLGLANGCSDNIPNNNPPDVVYKARAFLPITSDTTKPMQMKPIFSQLYYRKIDTLDMITGTYLGKSLTVDASDQLKQIFFRITRELRDTIHGK